MGIVAAIEPDFRLFPEQVLGEIDQRTLGKALHPRRPARGRPQTLRGTLRRPVWWLKKDLNFIFKG